MNMAWTHYELPAAYGISVRSILPFNPMAYAQRFSENEIIFFGKFYSLEPGNEFKGYVLFPNKKHNVHRYKLNLHSLKIIIVESFPWNFTYWDAVVFEKWVKVIIFVSVLAFQNAKPVMLWFWYNIITG